MCGRYGFTIENKEEFLKRFDLENAAFEMNDSYNVAPTQEMPIIVRHSPNSMEKRAWGIQPAWSKMFIINAKTEKLADSRFWNKPLQESRCIVPANWFYEWKKLSDGKQPYFIRLKSKAMFGFAGLIMTVKDKQGNDKTGYVIITTAANEIMSPIHERMPVILEKRDEEDWLNPDNVEPENLTPLLKQYPSSEMEMYPISSLVNNTKNNFPEIIKPTNFTSDVEK